MVVKARTVDDTPDMGKCHATRRVTRQVKVNGKKVRLSGRVRCRKYLAAHYLHPKIKHGGQFNHNSVEWKPKDKEVEEYQRQREQLIREAAKN